MSGGRAQLPLDLRHRPAMGREDFLVSPSNADAVKWIDLWPDWPGPALVLCGAPGSGKTHLGEVWETRSDALVCPQNLTEESPLAVSELAVGAIAAGACVLVDDVDLRADDAALFHLFNSVVGAGGHMLFLARTPPARWRGRLADLVSRLSAAPNVRIHAPDESLMAAVMIKMFPDRHLTVGADVLAYLVARMERSFDEARRLVAELDAASLASRRGVTLPLAREILEARGRAG